MPVIDLLLRILNDGNKGVRKTAAAALKKFYNNRCLDPQVKKQILEMQSVVAHPPHDHTSSDCGSHTEPGICVKH